jgi:hypothetical protein
MSLVDIIRQAQASPLVDRDREPISLELLPPLSDPELRAFAKTLPCAIPPDVAELLQYCRGFNGTIDQVDFTSETLSFEQESVFPYGLPIGHDGYGNHWVVDLHPDSVQWGPIYFACHDAPVILFQSATLDRFLTELFLMYTPPFRSEIDDVHEDRLFNVWRQNPGVLSFEECRESPDSALSSFASQLDETYQIIDLRGAVPGQGFSWGRYGWRTVLKRYGSLPIFAYQKRPPSFLKRIFGRA